MRLLLPLLALAGCHGDAYVVRRLDLYAHQVECFVAAREPKIVGPVVSFSSVDGYDVAISGWWIVQRFPRAKAVCP